VIDEEAVVRAGIVKHRRDGIKVLGRGNIDYPVSLKMNLISRGAREKIEAAGGSIIEVV
jgi:large subunit ribosomal protein L15